MGKTAMKKWIWDIDRDNLINMDKVDHIWLEYKGENNGYVNPYSVLVESESSRWVLFESKTELAAKTFLMDLEMKLNSTKGE